MALTGSYDDWAASYRRSVAGRQCKICGDDWTAARCQDCGHPTDDTERAWAIRQSATSGADYLRHGAVGAALERALDAAPASAWLALRDDHEPIPAVDELIGALRHPILGVVEVDLRVAVDWAGVVAHAIIAGQPPHRMRSSQDAQRLADQIK